MKKFVIATTTLLSGAVLAGSALAGGLENYPTKAEAMEEPAKSTSPLTVGVGGFIDFQAGFASQKDGFETGANSRDLKFQNDTEIHLSVDGKTDSGLGYGAVVELDADVTADGDNEHAVGGVADKTYLYLQGNKFGRVELGNVDGAENRLKVDAASISRATGGIDGDWYDFVNTTGGFLLGPDLPLADAAGITEDATKISYYTNRMAGFQAGVSFTPDSGNGGTAAGFTSDSNAGNFENVVHAGVNYKRNFNKVDLELSGTGAFGESESAALEDLSAWALGAKLGSGGFSVAGSYGDWGDSGQAVGGTGDAKFWNAGVAYEHGPWGASVSYLNSERNDNDLSNLVVGADYQLAPGLVPYVEASFYDLDQAATATDNEGNVVLIGTQLNF
jgi:outer membrane protein OmpU